MSKIDALGALNLERDKMSRKCWYFGFYLDILIL